MFGLDPEKPLITFIGRLVGEKAADVLPEAIRNSKLYLWAGWSNDRADGFKEIGAALQGVGGQ